MKIKKEVINKPIVKTEEQNLEKNRYLENLIEKRKEYTKTDEIRRKR